MLLAGLSEWMAMENATMQVERLDRGRPPPGYNLEVIDDEWWWGESPEWLDGTSYFDHDVALRAAWAHYGTSVNPPGVQVDWDAVTGWGFTIIDGPRVHVAAGSADDGLQGRIGPAKAKARAAAWTWYWRRVGLIERMLKATTSVYGQEGTTECRNLWPTVLAWPDEQVDDVLALLRGEVAICG
jgi:hypothetical protein